MRARIDDDAATLTAITRGVLCVVALLASAYPASAQLSLAPQRQASTGDDARQRELSTAREQQKRANELQEKLKADLAAIGQDRGKLNAAIDRDRRARSDRRDRHRNAERTLAAFDAREQGMRVSLQSRRGEIVEVLAALQRAGRRRRRLCWCVPRTPCSRCAPRCCSARWCRTCARARTSWPATSANWSRCGRPSPPSATAGERSRQAEDDQTRLAALVQERQKQAERHREGYAMRSASARSALAKQAESLQDLIAKMEQDVKAAAKAAAAATAGNAGRPATASRIWAL